MSRGPARFTQADVRRLLAAAKQELGPEIVVEMLPDGTVRAAKRNPEPDQDPGTVNPKPGIVLC